MTQPPQDEPEQDSQQPSDPAGPLDGYGRAPDPSPAYPGPEEGGVAPLPDLAAGGYGPPGPGYGSAQPGPVAQGTDSLRRSWKLFAANPWPFVISQILWGLIIVVPVFGLLAAFGVFGMVADGRSTASLSALFGLGGVLAVLLAVLLSVIQQGAFATATLKAVDDGQVGLGDFFRPRHLPQLLLLAVLLAIASALLAVTGIGPLIVLFFGIWAVLIVVDRGTPALEALTDSVKASLRRPGETIVLVLAGYVLNAIGALLCGIGTLVTTPVTALAFADFYRRSGSFSPR